MKLVKGHMTYDIRKYFLSERIINVWNSLPTNVVNASIVNELKIRYMHIGLNKK